MQGDQKEMLSATRSNSLVVNQSFLTKEFFQFQALQSRVSAYPFLKDNHLCQEIVNNLFFLSNSFLFKKKKKAKPELLYSNCKRRVIASTEFMKYNFLQNKFSENVLIPPLLQIHNLDIFFKLNQRMLCSIPNSQGQCS